MAKKIKRPNSSLPKPTNDLLFGTNNKDEINPIILLINSELVIQDINLSGARKLFHKNRQDLIGLSFIELLKEQKINYRPLLNIFNSNYHEIKTLKLVISQKTYFVTITAVPVQHPAYFAITMTAINETYKELKTYINEIINNLPGAVYWKDKDGHYMGCNKFVAKMAGYDSPEQMIGKTDYDLCWNAFADEWRLLDQKVIEDDSTIVREEKAQLSNGQIITELTFKTPLKNEHGEIIGIIGTSLDITERKEMEAALHQSQIALKAANLAKTEFIANMSHDIRTPLTGVVGMSKLLEDKVQDSSQKQYAQWLGESGAQLLNMLNVILDTVSADNVNETDLHEEPFDLNQVILDILQLERPSTLTKGINLKTHVDKSIPPCLISDHTKIHRILLNLLGNAIKFTQTGQIEIDVKLVKKRKTHVLLHFSVSDTGIGIPYDLQNKVFDKFFRVTPSYKGVYTGHGLGLHIAQSYAHLLGGKIKLTSEPGSGTIFYFDLSLKIADNVHDGVPSKANERLDKMKILMPSVKSVHASEITRNLPRLLLVEDNHIALLTLENIASQAGWLFRSAINGETALILAKTESFDLIITDLGLPGMSGIDFTKQLRTFENGLHKKPTPIIGLTAHAEFKIKIECLQSGMNATFTKPMNPETLEKIKLTYLSSINTASIKPEPTVKDTSKKLGTDLPDSEEELFKLEDFPLLDTYGALFNMGNNEVLLNNVLKCMTEQEIPNDSAELENAYRSNDWETIEKLAHRMKGGLLYCGTTKLVYACQYLERYRKAGHIKLLEPLYHQLCMVIEETKDEISKWLKQR
ncbi:histidine kinase [Legionella antarctica]|uniref:histidine kinase n=1 Tax=Legionella antarctica TaxID=2708020 RepID=A0A6F8T613_9GAMM|nr:ATP-binding protein [Legionella antarctica]BCA95590.1 histidine kinase [Legionella antarctica]